MFKDYYECRAWLERFIPQTYTEKNLGLARIRHLLRLLGNPQDKFKSILIAGTSGKGSTAFYTARLLQKSIKSSKGTTSTTGFEIKKARDTRDTFNSRDTLKIGLHLSPHLSYIGERMQINSKPITPKNFIRLVSHIRPIVESMAKTKVGLPSYFEILVAASFKYFANEKVDWAVVEVGLGGRLDATNVLKQDLSVITNVGLDHTAILGNTIERIAYEKAGIIKRIREKESKRVKVITASRGKALEVIRKVAKERNVELITESTPISTFNYLIIYRDILSNSSTYVSEGVFFCALSAVNSLGVNQTKAKISEAFNSPFPGRFEEIDTNVVIDGAHNLDKVKELVKWIKNRTTDYRLQTTAVDRRPSTVALVCAFKKGKDWKKMLDYLSENLDIQRYIITQFYTPTDTGFFSSVEPRDIAKYLESKIHHPASKVQTFDNSHEAVFASLTAKRSNANQLFLITGSMYLVGEARTIWGLPPI